MDAAKAMRARLRADLQAAMRRRDSLAASTLRGLIAALDNAQAVALDLSGPASPPRPFGDGTGEVPRRALSAADVTRALDAERAARLSAAAEMARLGRIADAERLNAEAALIVRYRAR